MAADPIRITGFDPRYAADFKRLNEAWITRYFTLVDADRVMLEDPQGQVIAPGGQILFVLDGEAVVGCCALKPIEGGFELCKMAVDETHQGRGLGRALLTAAIDRARAAGARRIYLESGQSLTPALSLYRSLGFVDLPARPSAFDRADVWMELRL
jgi:ribosomal protein S18 acetylase RimI-like enzyme